jgi:hypothetical protein
MDLYTLTDTFLAKAVVDEYISAIWTERYTAAGDVQLVVPYSVESADKLREGTFLALRGTKEVMQLESISIENSTLTAVGKSLPVFLNQRYAWFHNQHTDADNPIADFTADDMVPGQFISEIVNLMVIDTLPMAGPWEESDDLDWDVEKIEGLSLGEVDMSGTVKKLTAVVGPLYDSIQQIAEKEGVGIKLYLEDADPVTGYDLKFATYQGKDRTSDQDVNELVRLVPDMDSLSDVKEVHSLASFKNVCYVYWHGRLSKHLLDPDDSEPLNMNRRVLITNAETNPVGHKVTTTYPGGEGYTHTVVDEADIAAFREQNARDALANHNYIRAIDGQTSPNNDYQYGVHYGLGDIIELEGITGTISKARITEFIRSEDNQGEKQYPTISVVTPTEGGG